MRESDDDELKGRQIATVRLRVTRPTALVLLKLLALDGRYRNIRGAPR